MASNRPLSAQHFVQCETQECGGNCQFYCNHCKQRLCEQCRDEHQRSRTTKHHEVVTFSETFKKHLGLNAKKSSAACAKITEIQEYFLPTSQELKSEAIDDAEEVKMIMNSIRMSIKEESVSLKNLVEEATSERYEQANAMETFLLENLKSQETTYEEFTEYLAKLVKELELYDQLPRTDVKNLSFGSLENLKIRRIPETTKPDLPEYAYGKFRKDDVSKLLGRITVPVVKNEKRKIKPKEEQTKQEGTTDAREPMAVTEVREFKVSGIDSVCHMSIDKSGRLWASDGEGNLVQIDPEGKQLQKIQTMGKDEGYHAVRQDGTMIYTDKNKRTINKRASNKKGNEFIKTGDWEPLSIHSSTINGDILVGMRKDREAKITRYNGSGKEMDSIQKDDKGDELYDSPLYITENINGDVGTSDYEKQAVVVVNKAGEHRFSYSGQVTEFHPYGICTDTIGHIIVSVGSLYNGSVEILDQDGAFLCRLFVTKEEIKSPRSVCVFDKNKLYVGQEMSNKVKVFKCDLE